MAVRALLHYALEVPDQTVGDKFYRSFGLVEDSGRDGAVHLRPVSLKRETVLLYPGPRKRLHHLALGAAGDEFEATRASIQSVAVKSRTSAPRRYSGATFDVSNAVSVAKPERPCRRLFQNRSPPMPMGETTPSPVMTA